MKNPAHHFVVINIPLWAQSRYKYLLLEGLTDGLLSMQLDSAAADELHQFLQVILSIVVSHLEVAAARPNSVATVIGLLLLHTIRQILETKEHLSLPHAANLVDYVRDNGDLKLSLIQHSRKSNC